MKPQLKVIEHDERPQTSGAVVLVGICPDCESMLQRFGHVYICPNALREGELSARGMVVAPENPVHPRVKIWRLEELVREGLYATQTGYHKDDDTLA